MQGIGATLLVIGLGLGTFEGMSFAHDTEPSGAASAKAATRDAPKASESAGKVRKVSRTIDVVMTDEMRFRPAVITVTEGETIRFRVRNAGTTLHEMVLGSVPELKEHAAMMRQAPEMAHDDANTVRVKPGATGEMIWTFDHPGETDYACLVAGHSEAGMIGKVVVKPRG